MTGCPVPVCVTSDSLISLKTAFHISFKVKPEQSKIYTMESITIWDFFFKGRDYLFWLMASHVSACCGREDVAEQISGHHDSKRPRKEFVKRPEPSGIHSPKAPPSAFTAF